MQLPYIFFHTLIAAVFIIQCFSSMITQSGDEGVSAVDSDFFLIYNKDSTLPVENIGNGVFAKRDIKKDSLICEYRGPIIESKDEHRLTDINMRNKLFSIRGPDGNQYSIVGTNVCALINDCTSIMNSTYTNPEIVSDSVLTNYFNGLVEGPSDVPAAPCYEGHDYNAAALSHSDSGKLFIVATRDIKANEEIYYPYGW